MPRPDTFDHAAPRGAVNVGKGKKITLSPLSKKTPDLDDNDTIKSQPTRSGTNGRYHHR